jgi:O-antigen/teichoic acid export membrane protein
MTRLRHIAGRIRDDHLVRNSGWIMATTLVNLMLGYLYWVIAARLLSHGALGLATSLVALMNVATLVFSVGLGPSLIASLPSCSGGGPWSRTLNTALLMAGGIALLASIGIVVGLPGWSNAFAPLADDRWLAALFVASSVVWTVASILDYAFVAERRADLMFARNLTFGVVKIPALPVAAALLGSSALSLLAGWAMSALASLALGVIVLIRRLARHYRPSTLGSRSAARALSRRLAGQHLTSVGGQLPIFVLPALVAARLGVAENAYFYIGWAAAGVFFLVSPAVAASLYTEATHDPAQLGGVVRRGVWTIAAVLGPAMLGLLVFGHAILSLFGPSYPKHAFPLLLPLAASAVPDAVTNIYISVLRVRHRLRLAAAINVGIAVTTLGLAWLLLPPLGIAGAGWAWFIAQAAGTAVVALDLYRIRRQVGAVEFRGAVR